MTPGVWVLILTMWASSSQSGKGIVAIEGFSSESACRTAGAAWLDSRPTHMNNPPFGKPELVYSISGWHSATCVRKS